MGKHCRPSGLVLNPCSQLKQALRGLVVNCTLYPLEIVADTNGETLHIRYAPFTQREGQLCIPATLLSSALSL